MAEPYAPVAYQDSVTTDQPAPPELVQHGGDATAYLLDALNTLEEQEINQLIEASEQSYLAGELDEFLGEPAQSEQPQEQETTPMADEEFETELEGGEDAGGGEIIDPNEVVTRVEAAAGEVESLKAQLETLADAADESDADVDVEKVTDAIIVCEEALEQIAEARTIAEDAETAVDVDKAEEAHELATKALEEAKAACEEAKAEAVDAASDVVPADEGDEDPLYQWAEENA